MDHLTEQQLDEENLLPSGTLVDGRYRIERYLGRGGFAIVYEALHTSLDRAAALKVLDLHGNSIEVARFRERFANEAKVAARIEHPNVVRIFDYGFVEQSQQPYIAMELLRGRDLEEELLEHGPLELERAVRLFTGVLDALGEAHANGVVHKDLKPSNLFISEPNTPRERMVVLDYGIARIYDVPDARLTQTNQYTGTPAYAAPEYIHHQSVSPALDVYQMGLIIAESLTGKPVVEASSPMAYFVAHCNGQQRIDPSMLGTPLGDMISRAVSVDPEHRYDSGASFKVALESLDVAEQSRMMKAAGHGQHISEEIIVRTAPNTGEEVFAPTLDSASFPAPITADIIAPPRQERAAPATTQQEFIGPKKKSASSKAPMLGCVVAIVGAVALVVAVAAAGLAYYTLSVEEFDSHEIAAPPAQTEVSVATDGADLSRGSAPTLSAPTTASPQLAGKKPSMEDLVRMGRGDKTISFKLSTYHRALFTISLMTESVITSYLYQAEASPTPEARAANASIKLEAGNYEYFLSSAKVANETSPDVYRELDRAAEEYLLAHGELLPIAEKLDAYWRIDRTWQRDGGKKATSLDVDLRAKWRVYLKKRDVYRERLLAIDKKNLEVQLSDTHVTTQPTRYRMLRALGTLQSLHEGLRTEPQSKQTAVTLETFREQLGELRSPQHRKGMSAEQSKMFGLLTEYLTSSREYIENRQKRHDNSNIDSAMRDMLDDVQLYGPTGQYVSIMELYYNQKG